MHPWLRTASSQSVPVSYSLSISGIMGYSWYGMAAAYCMGVKSREAGRRIEEGSRVVPAATRNACRAQCGRMHRGAAPQHPRPTWPPGAPPACARPRPEGSRSRCPAGAERAGVRACAGLWGRRAAHEACGMRRAQGRGQPTKHTVARLEQKQAEHTAQHSAAHRVLEELGLDVAPPAHALLHRPQPPDGRQPKLFVQLLVGRPAGKGHHGTAAWHRSVSCHDARPSGSRLPPCLPSQQLLRAVWGRGTRRKCKRT